MKSAPTAQIPIETPTLITRAFRGYTPHIMRLTRLFLAVCVFTASLAWSAPADSDGLPAGVQFRNAYQAIILADEVRDEDDFIGAMNLYEKALNLYAKLAREYPHWQPSITKFRMSYCKDQLEGVLKHVMDNETFAKRKPSAPGIRNPAMPSATKIRTKHYAACELLKSGKPIEARKLLMDELLENPDDVTVRLLIGIARCQEGKFADALYLLEPVIAEAPQNPDAHVALGAAYFGLSRMADARKVVSRAIKLNPHSSEACYNMAQILMTEDPPDIRAAKTYYKLSLESGGKSDSNLEKLLGL